MDHGSRKPCNWVEKALPQSTIPVLPNQPAPTPNSQYRQASQPPPITTQGSFHGQPSQLRAPKDPGPNLFLNQPQTKQPKQDTAIQDLISQESNPADRPLFGDVASDSKVYDSLLMDAGQLGDGRNTQQAPTSPQSKVVDPHAADVLAAIHAATASSPLIAGPPPVTPLGETTPGQEQQLNAAKQGIGPRGGKYTITSTGKQHYPTHAHGASPEAGSSIYHKSFRQAIDILKNFGVPKVPLQQQQPTPSKQPGESEIPNNTSASQEHQQPQQPPLGFTPNGLTVHNDPFHPEHKDFGKEDHEAAANLHDEHAHEDPMHAQHAQIHRELAKDVMSPMARVSEQVAQRGEVPRSNEPQGGRQGFGSPQNMQQGVGGIGPQAMGIFSKPDSTSTSLATTPPGTGPGAPPALAAPKPIPQMTPFQNKPPVGLPSGADRQGPIPGMVQKPAPPQAAMTSLPQMPSSGSSTKQLETFSTPPKNIGMNAPPTNAGSQQTAIEPSVVKQRPQQDNMNQFLGLM